MSPLPSPSVVFEWQTVVNNGVKVPVEGDNRKFNSYNPPSLNVTGWSCSVRAPKAGWADNPSTASSREIWPSRRRL